MKEEDFFEELEALAMKEELMEIKTKQKPSDLYVIPNDWSLAEKHPLYIRKIGQSFFVGVCIDDD